MKNIAIIVFFVAAAVCGVRAQDVAGKWEGTLNYKAAGGVDAVTYDWDFAKWSTAFTIYDIRLELKQVRGEKYTGTYYMNCKGCTSGSEFRFDAVFADPELKGATEGLPVKGGNNPAYMELQVREEGGRRVLEGTWKSSRAGAVWQGKVALGLVGPAAAAAKPEAPKPAVAAVIEEDVAYVIERSDDGRGLRTESDGIATGGASGKWKFAKAPGKYAEYWRIMPDGREDHCLEVEPESGKVAVKPCQDSDTGEQYWALDRKGDFYFLRCIGTKGTQVLDNDDNGDGHTIVRRKEENDAGQVWRIRRD